MTISIRSISIVNASAVVFHFAGHDTLTGNDKDQLLDDFYSFVDNRWTWGDVSYSLVDHHEFCIQLFNYLTDIGSPITDYSQYCEDYATITGNSYVAVNC